MNIMIKNYKINSIRIIFFGFTACSYKYFSYEFIFVEVLHKNCLLSLIELN